MPPKELDPCSAKKCVTFPFFKIYNLKIHFGDQMEDGLGKYQEEFEEEDELWAPLIQQTQLFQK